MTKKNGIISNRQKTGQKLREKFDEKTIEKGLQSILESIFKQKIKDNQTNFEYSIEELVGTENFMTILMQGKRND